MSGWEHLAVLAAGIAAGGVNAVVGSGTLITFPVLLAAGYPAVVANVSNAVGLVPGSAAAAWGYRLELAGQGRRLARLALTSFCGALTGAVLLLIAEETFRAVVPVLIVGACALVVAQPLLSRRLRVRRRLLPQPLFLAAVYATGVYGGYFGAGQGVILIGLLGVGLGALDRHGLPAFEDIQRVNAAKNVLGGLNNLVAGVLFVVVGEVAWRPALLIAAGSVVGGQAGAKIGRRLPPAVLRAVVVAVGIVAAAHLLLT